MFVDCIEQGPIRPPSEAASLLLRVTRHCPWNRCEFCHIYRGRRFEPRKAEEVKRDIDTLRDLASRIRDLSLQRGFGGTIHAALARHLGDTPRPYPEGARNLLFWMAGGARNVFLQDADNLALKTEKLVDILRYLRDAFPTVERITTYARSATLARKSPEELAALREAGLSRIHTGMESGCDTILARVQKGVTARVLIDAGRKVKQAGLGLSEYVMPGLGGKALTREHALETARALNEIDPDFIRVRPLKVLSTMPLFRRVESGEMELLGDDGILAEERLLIGHLDRFTGRLESDHVLNLLEEVEGRFPAARRPVLALIDRYLALPEGERAHFRLGRRTGFYRRLADRENPVLRAEVAAILRRVESGDPGGLDLYLSRQTESFI
ncbi:MAG: radical SAM protein [Acidobacteria bacterium]|nr:radical SAM protein [Acidobacteriota bacterium]